MTGGGGNAALNETSQRMAAAPFMSSLRFDRTAPTIRSTTYRFRFIVFRRLWATGSRALATAILTHSYLSYNTYSCE